VARDRRLFWNGFLLCLPAAMIIAGGSYFLYDKVPQIVRNEHRRVVAEYRLVAEDLKNGELSPERVIVENVKRPKSARKMKPGRWDYEAHEGGRLVWYAEGEKSLATKVETIDEVDYGTLMYAAGVFFMLLFAGITALGVRYFWMFASERDDFLAASAHDLATPLIGMRYAIGRNDEDARILNERMIRLVENIREFLKLGGKRRQPVFEPVDLKAAYDEAYSLFREDYRDLFNGEDVVTIFRDAGPFTVKADSTMLVQILWNLLGNDLKYAAPYGRVKAVFSRCRGRVRMELADEGQGMTKRQMKKAFDRYYRSRTVLESGKGGFGIGLCTAKEFAVAMGGTLSVGTNSPKGCVFTLELPAI
jgi:signal transduction histidine kinase